MSLCAQAPRIAAESTQRGGSTASKSTRTTVMLGFAASDLYETCSLSSGKAARVSDEVEFQRRTG